MPDVLGYLNSKGLAIKPAGAHNIHTHCMFCNEDPSSRGRLYIQTDPEAEVPGLYFCHLCQAKGNLTSLKRHYGDDVDERDIDANTRADLFETAARYYQDQLNDYRDVEDYLLSPDRNLSHQTIIKFRLGYAPMDFVQDVGAETITARRPRGLYDHLLLEGFQVADIVATGLCNNHDGRVLDALGGMVTIPYLVAGQVAAIRGRAWPLKDDDWARWDGAPYDPPKAKYKTCGGTQARLFNTDATWNQDEVFVTEGEFDAMVLAQQDYAAVGVPGANIWQDAWDGYMANVKRIWLVFDRDVTGEKAAQKFVDRFGSKVRRIHLSEEGQKCDPTEWFTTHTAAEFDQLIKASGRGGLLVTVDEALVEFEQFQGQQGLSFAWEMFDTMIRPGLLAGQLMLILAKTGCLTGDTEIAFNRCGKGFKMPIAKAYERWTGGRYAWDHKHPTMAQRADGDVVRLGQVSEIWYSGKKAVYQLTTDTGRTIKATAEHPFLTPTGFRRLDELVPGDQVCVNAGRSAKGRAKKPWYAQRSGLLHHPFRGKRTTPGTNQNCVPLHRLVAEARLSSVHVDEFIDRCRTGGIQGLRFLDPAIWAVHHIDHDHTNNEPANLKVLTHSEHHALHAAEGKGDQVLEQVGVERVVSSTYIGVEDTYDISMADEPHNFMANGFAVHNTGKTVMLLNLMHRLRMAPGQEDLKILFVSLEQTRGEWWDRARRIHTFYNLDASEADAAKFWRDNIMIIDQNRVTEVELAQAVDDFEYELGAKPDVICLDYLGYWARGFKGEAYERASNAIMSLKGTAKDLRIPIIAPHQVSRVGIDGQEFGAEAARDSGVIEETADFLLPMWSPDNAMGREAEERSGRIHMRIAKSRHGGRGTLLNLQFAPISLVIVPDEDPLTARARKEFAWWQHYRDDWHRVVHRHRTGDEGHLEEIDGEFYPKHVSPQRRWE